MGLIRSKRSNIMAEPRAVCMTLREAFAERTKNSHNCAFFQRFNACPKWRRAPAGAPPSTSRGRVIPRSVAQDESSQLFYPRMVGNAKCFGHVQCDSIIMGSAKIRSIPEIAANSTDAQLIHEAAIGKIAGDQLLKLQTLGLTAEEAEDTILKGFLA